MFSPWPHGKLQLGQINKGSFLKLKNQWGYYLDLRVSIFVKIFDFHLVTQSLCNFVKDCTGARDREQGGETGRCGAQHSSRPQTCCQLQQAAPDSLHAGWDGIHGHQFVNKRLECFALCCSKSRLLADFKENHTGTYSSLVLSINTKKIESIYE